MGLSGYHSAHVAFVGPVTLIRDACGGLCFVKMAALGQGSKSCGMGGGGRRSSPGGQAWARPPTMFCPAEGVQARQRPRGADHPPSAPGTLRLSEKFPASGV